MGGVVQAVAKPLGLAPKAPVAAPAPAPAPAALEAKQGPEDRAAGLGRAESEIQGQLAARKGRRGRASTVLGAADETAGGMTAAKRLLGE
jgi:hypothetical protein